MESIVIGQRFRDLEAQVFRVAAALPFEPMGPERVPTFLPSSRRMAKKWVPYMLHLNPCRTEDTPGRPKRQARFPLQSGLYLCDLLAPELRGLSLFSSLQLSSSGLMTLKLWPQQQKTLGQVSRLHWRRTTLQPLFHPPLRHPLLSYLYPWRSNGPHIDQTSWGSTPEVANQRYGSKSCIPVRW